MLPSFEILGGVIGVIFIYLLLSLICTALNEAIEAFLKNRARDLERGIRELLGDKDGNGYATKFYNHPLVAALFKDAYVPGKGRKQDLPSYVPARIFALALMDIVMPATATCASGAKNATAPPPSPEAHTSELTPQELFREAINKIDNERVKQALLPLVDAAGDDIGRARENIETWFNSAMERVSGWYKRRTQWILLVLGLIVAIGTNADSVAIARSLSDNAALRQSLAAIAEGYARTNPASPEQVETTLVRLQQLGLPLGWTSARSMPALHTPADAAQWGLKIVGWLLTTFAVSLGAPFWFDLLNKFIVVRSTIKPNEKSAPEKSKD